MHSEDPRADAQRRQIAYNALRLGMPSPYSNLYSDASPVRQRNQQSPPPHIIHHSIPSIHHLSYEFSNLMSSNRPVTLEGDGGLWSPARRPIGPANPNARAVIHQELQAHGVRLALTFSKPSTIVLKDDAADGMENVGQLSVSSITPTGIETSEELRTFSISASHKTQPGEPYGYCYDIFLGGIHQCSYTDQLATGDPDNKIEIPWSYFKSLMPEKDIFYLKKMPFEITAYTDMEIVVRRCLSSSDPSSKEWAERYLAATTRKNKPAHPLYRACWNDRLIWDKDFAISRVSDESNEVFQTPIAFLDAMENPYAIFKISGGHWEHTCSPEELAELAVLMAAKKPAKEEAKPAKKSQALKLRTQSEVDKDEEMPDAGDASNEADDNITVSKTVKNTKGKAKATPTSPVWRHVTKHANGEVSCDHCKAVLNYDHKHKSTSVLIHHLKVLHQIEFGKNGLKGGSNRVASQSSATAPGEPANKKVSAATPEKLAFAARWKAVRVGEDVQMEE